MRKATTLVLPLVLVSCAAGCSGAAPESDPVAAPGDKEPGAASRNDEPVATPSDKEGGRRGVASTPAHGQHEDPARPLRYPTPRKGLHLVVAASAALPCPLRVTSRSYDFPAGAEDRAVSITGKTMCFAQDTTIHCHVSGTGTGFCEDTVNNVVNALLRPATLDGDFILAYVAAHPGRRRNVSGHSQGAYDASRAAPVLGHGDQLILVQPASSALLPNEALRDSSGRGARVYVGWSPNDDASLGIRPTAGLVPLLEFPLQDLERVHNAPNARDLFMRSFAIEDGQTPNPAFDASILSNPGSPHGVWRFPVWRP